MTGGDHIACVLKRRGVRFLYTLCGGHISPILVSAKARGIRVVDVRHEATAVFAADATARLSGVPGVAAVTAGPGATNALTAVKNAELAQSPVLLLGGATATLLRGRGSIGGCIRGEGDAGPRGEVPAPATLPRLIPKRQRELRSSREDSFAPAAGPCRSRVQTPRPSRRDRQERPREAASPPAD